MRRFLELVDFCWVSVLGLGSWVTGLFAPDKGTVEPEGGACRYCGKPHH